MDTMPVARFTAVRRSAPRADERQIAARGWNGRADRQYPFAEVIAPLVGAARLFSETLLPLV